MFIEKDRFDSPPQAHASTPDTEVLTDMQLVQNRLSTFTEMSPADVQATLNQISRPVISQLAADVRKKIVFESLHRFMCAERVHAGPK